jgi:hypothetical protein
VLSGAVGLSFQNAVLAELFGQPAAGLISYSLADTPEPISDELPAVLAPLHELTSRVPGTWYCACARRLSRVPRQRSRLCTSHRSR